MPQPSSRSTVAGKLNKIKHAWFSFKKSWIAGLITLLASCSTLAYTAYFGWDAFEEKAVTLPKVRSLLCGYRLRVVPNQETFTSFENGRKHAIAGDWSKSAEILGRLSLNKIGIPNLHQTYAAVLIEIGQLEKAEAELRDEIKVLDCFESKSDEELQGLSLFAIDQNKNNQSPEIRAILKRTRALTYYNWACLLAAKSEGEKAMDQLQKAVDLGYRNADQLGRDRFFSNIRDSVRFQQILSRLGN